MILIRDNWLLVAGYTVIKPGGKTCLCVCCKITLISYVHLRKCVSDCGIMLIALIDFDCSFFSTGSRPPEKVTGSNAVWQNHTAKPKLLVKQLIKGEESNLRNLKNDSPTCHWLCQKEIHTPIYRHWLSQCCCVRLVGMFKQTIFWFLKFFKFIWYN